MNNSPIDYRLFKLEQLAIKNNIKVKKMQRLIYLLENNINLYVGKNGGIYYETCKSRIYI